MRATRMCMRDVIRNAVVARIQDGTYPPGTHLKELALAREFDVSQAPVREALRELESLGLVHADRYRGSRVRAVTPDETREAYQLRACLEEAAARLAVPVSADELALLQQDADGLLAAAKAKDLECYARCNIAFHRRIVAISGNRAMLRVWDSLGWEVRSRMALQVVHKHRQFMQAVKEHQAILDLLKAGDGEAAGRLLGRHGEPFLDELEHHRQA